MASFFQKFPPSFSSSHPKQSIQETHYSQENWVTVSRPNWAWPSHQIAQGFNSQSTDGQWFSIRGLNSVQPTSERLFELDLIALIHSPSLYLVWHRPMCRAAAEMVFYQPLINTGFWLADDIISHRGIYNCEHTSENVTVINTVSLSETERKGVRPGSKPTGRQRKIHQCWGRKRGRVCVQQRVVACQGECQREKWLACKNELITLLSSKNTMMQQMQFVKVGAFNPWLSQSLGVLWTSRLCRSLMSAELNP